MFTGGKLEGFRHLESIMMAGGSRRRRRINAVYQLAETLRQTGNHRGSFQFGFGIFDMLALLFSMVGQPGKTEENNLSGHVNQDFFVMPKFKVAPSAGFKPGT